MMLVPAGIKVHMAVGYTDMRKGIDGLAVLVEQILEKDPFSGHMFVFRGKRADMIKVLFWDGSGLCLLTKRLEEGRFAWPVADEHGLTVTMTAAQLSMVLEGLDWQNPGASVAAYGSRVSEKLLLRRNKFLVENRVAHRINHAPRPHEAADRHDGPSAAGARSRCRHGAARG